jgi:hypothetical protein
VTFAPQSLKDLAAFWIAQGGVNLGIVGDTDHLTKGVSYHLGKDQLRADAYSAQTPRDKAGLTNAASAIDLGRLDGSLTQLREFSDWLARLCVKNVPGTLDVREVIYSPDGKRVLGFKDGIDFLIPNYGDLSHLTHTHISYYRDSEFRDKRPLFEPYFVEDPVITPGDDINYGWEEWTLDGDHTVYCLGGPRNDDGTTDPTMRLCAAGPGSPVMTFVSRSRLTDGKQVPGSDALLAMITSGTMAVDCDDVVAVELGKAADRAHDAVLAR